MYTTRAPHHQITPSDFMVHEIFTLFDSISNIRWKRKNPLAQKLTKSMRICFIFFPLQFLDFGTERECVIRRSHATLTISFITFPFRLLLIIKPTPRPSLFPPFFLSQLIISSQHCHLLVTKNSVPGTKLSKWAVFNL